MTNEIILLSEMLMDSAVYDTPPAPQLSRPTIDSSSGVLLPSPSWRHSVQPYSLHTGLGDT